jgi:hypothetical protein
MIKIKEHPGYIGVFTTHQDRLAKFPNGLRVIKIKMERGDANPIGTKGTVLGSIVHPDAGTGYFVEWDSMPKMAVFVVEWKIEKLEV